MIKKTKETFKKEKLFPKKCDTKISNSKTPKFYISLKFHKPINPRRKVMNSNECHTSEVWRFVGNDLQPVLKTFFFV